MLKHVLPELMRLVMDLFITIVKEVLLWVCVVL